MSNPTGVGRRRIGGVIGTILVVVVALALIGYGGYRIWLQHSGTAASVHLDHCSSKSVGRSYHWLQTCTGEWQKDDGTSQKLTVHDVPKGSVHTDVSVRIHGNDGYVNSFRGGPLPLLGGVALLGIMIF